MPTQIKIDLSDVRRKLGLVAEGMRKGLLLTVEEWLRHVIIQSFNEQRTPEGAPWPRLSQRYVNSVLTSAKASRKKRAVLGRGLNARRLAGLKMLDRSGSLIRSIINGIAIGDDRVSATSSLPHAAVHQFGARISIPEVRPRKQNGVLCWAGPGGEPIFARRARAHMVTIPARSYLPSPEFAERESAKVIEETLQEAINQAGAGA